MRTGRPRQFNRDEAVRQAMHLFWDRGFDSTSLSQLKSAIGNGITAPSFYAAFGSKEKLFQEAVDCYLQSHGRVTEALWQDELPPRDAIESTLLRSARMQCADDHPNLLAMLEAQNICVEFQCREGYCGSCRTRLLKGEVYYAETPLAFVEQGEILPCCCRAKGEIEIAL